MKRKMAAKQHDGGRSTRARPATAAKRKAAVTDKIAAARAVAQARKIAARRRREAIPPDEEPLTFIQTRPSPLDAEQTESAEVTEFSLAMERYKRDYGRPFPAWSEVLHVLRSLGYRKAGEDREGGPSVAAPVAPPRG